MRTTESDSRTICELDELFLDQNVLECLLEEHGAPLCVYDENGLRRKAQSILALFEGSGRDISVPVQACCHKQLLSIIAEENWGAYCRTPEELQIALDAGFPGHRITYAALVLSKELAQTLRVLDARLILAAPDLADGVLPRRVDLACSPKHPNVSCKATMPAREHIGLLREEVMQLIPKLAKAGVELGLAIIEGMNITDCKHFPKKVESLLRFANELESTFHVKIHRIHAGEGPGTSYRRLLLPMDVDFVAQETARLLQGRSQSLAFNVGRYLIDSSAIFACKVVAIYRRRRPILVVNATSEQLMMLNGTSYRFLSIVGKNWKEGRKVCDVIGYIATTVDVFGNHVILPEAEVGDILIVHDIGTAIPSCSGFPTFLYCRNGTFLKLQ